MDVSSNIALMLKRMEVCHLSRSHLAPPPPYCGCVQQHNKTLSILLVLATIALTPLTGHSLHVRAAVKSHSICMYIYLCCRHALTQWTTVRTSSSIRNDWKLIISKRMYWHYFRMLQQHSRNRIYER